jgi:hypothetical protein
VSEPTPTFFKDRRLAVYCKGGRLKQDKKTGVRSWRLKPALTVTDDDAHAAGGAILSNYEHIAVDGNAAQKIDMGGSFGGFIVTVYPLPATGVPLLIRLDKCAIEDFEMTRSDGLTELWLQMEHENTSALHNFVRDYAFTTFYVEFERAQRSFGDALQDPAQEFADEMQRMADEHGISTTISTSETGKVAEFKPRRGSKGVPVN